MGRFINPFTDYGFKFLFGREVEESTIFKVRLLTILHFYDYPFTCVSHTVDIVDNPPFCFYFRLLFVVKELDVGNHVLSRELIVQEVD